MAKMRESSTDKDLYQTEEPDIDALKKPDWVNLTSLEGARHDNLFDKLLYKPALRFHGLTGGLWGQGLSGSPSVITDSRPPSYKVKDPLAATYMNDASTMYDQGSLYNTNNISAVSPLTLRRRNTVAVVLVAAALLAAIAAVTGVILHFIQPQAIIRANVRFTIANQNFTDDMRNASSKDFKDIADPLCVEMDIYYLTSELSEFYYGCKVKSLRRDKKSDRIAVHYTLDFLENKLTKNKDRIRQVILNKSGRHKTDNTLFLVIDDFWVYLRSLRIDLESIPIDGKRPQRPRIPWRNDIDFITRESNTAFVSVSSVSVSIYNPNQNVSLQSSYTNQELGQRHVLPGVNKNVLPELTVRVFNHASFISTPLVSLTLPSDVVSVSVPNVSVLSDVSKRPMLLNKEHTYIPIQPTKSLQISTIIPPRKYIEIIDLPIAKEFYIQPHEDIQGIFRKDDINNVYARPITGFTSSPTLSLKKPSTFANKPHVKDLLSVETSFDVTSATPYHVATESLASYKDVPLKQDDATPNNQHQVKKVLNLFSDVFLIVGKDFNMDVIPTERKPLSMLRKPFNNEDIMNPVIQELPQSYTFFRSQGTPELQTDISKQAHLSYNIKTEIDGLSLGISSSTDSVQTTVSSIQNVPDSSASLHSTDSKDISQSQYTHNGIKQEIHNEPVIGNDELVMKEILVEDPVQMPIPVADDIQWVNILNMPQKVTRIDVGHMSSETLTNTFYNKTSVLSKSPLSVLFDHDVNFSVNTDGEVIKHSDKVNKSPSNSSLISANNGLPGNKYMDILPANDIQNSRQMFGGDTSVKKYLKANDFDIEDVIRLLNGAPLYNTAIQTINSRLGLSRKQLSHSFPAIHHQHQRSLLKSLRTPAKKVQHVSALMPDAFHWDHTSRKHGSKMLARRTHPSGILCPDENASILRTQETKENQNPYPIDNHMNADSLRQSNLQKRTFEKTTKKDVYTYYKSSWLSQRKQNPHMLNNGIEFANPYPSIYTASKYQANYGNLNTAYMLKKNMHLRESMNSHNNYASSPKHFVKTYFGNRNGAQYFRSHGNKKGYFYSENNMNNDFRGTYVPLKAYWDPNNMPYIAGGFTDVNPAQNPLSGFTEFYNVSDIYEMKETLKQLIESMHNMSHKLDTMQNAINFINKTLHESQQPIHKLDKTFENMTKSFDNFNRNLIDIKDILNNFKTFLRPFDNTIFNIDDIIGHIDKTVENLDKTSVYVGISMRDLGDTVNNVTGSLSDLNGSLKHVNMSVFHVNNTAKYTNKTLDSMEKTLESLDIAIKNMNLKLDEVLGGIDGINVSLISINETVQSSHGRLIELQNRLTNMNGTVKRIQSNIEHLNDTYRKINETLQSMNEPIMITEGTILQVVNKLGKMDGELLNISVHMDDVDGEILMVNDSLESTVNWMKQMLMTLKLFNVSVDTSNETISLSSNNMELIDTVGILLKINSTLHVVGKHIDKNNIKIDTLEVTLDGLEDNLANLDDMLAVINYTFTLLNDTLKNVNSTLLEVRQPLQSMNENVKRINYSFEDLHKTFENIDKTLGIANQTLRKVSTSTDDIDKSLLQVMDTLNKTDMSVSHFNASVRNLNRSLNSMNGSLKKLKDGIYNKNETLKVVKSKVNITVSSFKILEETVTGINKTIDGLLKKLNETLGALNRTNTSLEDVNTTIGAIEDTYRDMSKTLDTIYRLFNKTQDSLQEFRIAFPTLTEKVETTDTEMRFIWNQIQNLHSKLDDNYNRRNYSVNKYDDIKSLFHDVYREVLQAKDTLVLANNHSKRVETNITELVQHVGSTEKNYLKLEKNIKFLDNAFDNVKNYHTRVQHDSQLLHQPFESAENRLSNLKEQYEDILTLGKNYTALLIPKEEIESAFKNQIQSLKEEKDMLILWNSKVNNASALVWDIDGNPENIHSDPDILEDHVHIANSTIKKFDDLVKHASSVLDGVFNAQGNISDLFKHIKSTASKVGDIQTATIKIGDKVAETEEQILLHSVNLNNIKKKLNEPMIAIEQLRNEFGDINGTFDTSNIYANIDELVKSIESRIHSLEQEDTMLSNMHLEAKLKHSFANNSFHKQPISIDKEGDKFINDTINILDESQSILNVIDDQLNLVEKSNVYLNSSLQELGQNIEDLKNLLQTKTIHHNFVQSSRPALEKTFDDVNVTFQYTNNTLERLKQFINSLYEKAATIDSKSIGMSNVDMSVADEKQLLNRIETTLTKLGMEVDVVSEKYTKSKKTFQKFRETDKDIDTVKKEYSKYQNQLEDFKRTLATVEIETSVIEKRLDDILNEFDITENSIDNYYAYKNKFIDIEHMVGNLVSNIGQTSDKVLKTSQTVIEINKTLDSMKEKYTNFSAASFNISKLYINEAVNELIDTFNNISEDFAVTKELGESMISFFNETNSRLLSHPLNRFNITRFLKKDIHPKSESMVIGIENINSSLNEIKAKLKDIETNSFRINNTLQIRNERLFVDEQKKLLADTKFPHLEQSINSLNMLLDISNTSLNDPFSELDKISETMSKVYRQIGNMTTVNMSDKHHTDVVTNLAGRLGNILKDIERNREYLLRVNDTVWSDDGKRYSHEESVQDIHNRYIDTENNLRSIADSIKEIQRNVSEISDSLFDLSDEMGILNNSLTAFDSLENDMGRINTFLSDLKADTYKTNNNLSRTGNLLELLNISLLDTKQRFSNINQKVLKDALDPISSRVTEGEKQHDRLVKSKDDILVSIYKIDQMFQDINEAKNKDVNSQTDLNDIIETVNNMIELISPELISSKTQVDILANKIPPLENELQSINSSLDETFSNLSRQEKVEFYTSHFDITQFDEIGREIEKTKFTNKHLNISLNSTNSELNDLIDYINAIENVDFDLGNLVDSLLSVDNTITKNKKTLNDLEKSYSSARRHFYAEDGNRISDKETIEEMKMRYRTLNDTLQYFNDTLLGVHVGQDLFDQLTESSVTMKNIGKKLDDLNKYSNVLKQLNEKADKLNHSVKSIQNQIYDQMFQSMSFEDDLFNLDSLFGGVNNTKINKTRNIIDSTKNELDVNLLSLKRDTANTADNLLDITNVVDSVMSKYNTGFKDMVELERFLNDLMNVERNAVDTLSNIDHFSVQSEDKLRSINNSLGSLSENIDLLELLLLHQEQLNFIEENAPVLQDKLSLIEKTINEVHMNTSSELQKVAILQGLQDIVESKIINNNLLSIPLENTSALIEKVQNGLLANEEDILTLNMSLNDIERDMFNKDGKYFGNQTTLALINKTYTAVSEKIESTKRSLNDISDYKSKVSYIVNETYDYLTDLLSEINKADAINSQIEPLDAKNVSVTKYMNMLEVGLDETESTLQEMKEMINIIKDRFTNVTDHSLLETTQNIASAIRRLQDNHTKAMTDFNKMKNIKSDSNVDFNYLKSILGRESTSFDVLKMNNKLSNKVANELNNTFQNLDKNLKISLSDSHFIKDATKNLLEQIDELEFKYTHTQMNQFVNATFPDIIEKIETFEDFLDVLANDIKNASNMRENVSAQLQSIKAKAWDQNLDALFDDLKTSRNIIDNELHSAFEQHQNLKKDLTNFVRTINKDFTSRDNLSDIAKRFQKYNNTLQALFERAIPVDESIQNIRHASNDAINDLENYDEGITRYSNITDGLIDLKENADSLDRIINRTSFDLNDANLNINLLKVQMDYIQEKFPHVNRSSLENTKQMIQYAIAEITEDVGKNVDKIRRHKNETFVLNDKTDRALTKGVQTIPDMLTLESLSNETELLRKAIENGLKNTDEELVHIADDYLPDINARISQAREAVSNLMDRYESEEKRDFILQNLPNILKDFTDLNKSLENNRNKISKFDSKLLSLNNSLQGIGDYIGALPNVFISLQSMRDKMATNKGNMQNLLQMLEKRQGKMNKVELDKLTPDILQKLTLTEVKGLFSDVGRLLNDTEESLSFMENTLSNTNKSVQDNEKKIELTKDLLDRYTNVKNTSDLINDELDKLNKSIHVTGNLLEDINSNFRGNLTRYRKLENEFIGIRNPEIDALYDIANNLIDEVNAKLSSANELYQKKLFPGNNKVHYNYENMKNSIDGLITDDTTFKTIIENAEITTSKLSDDMEILGKDDSNCRDEELILDRRIANFSRVMEDLDKALKRQTKRELLETNIPKLKEELSNLTDVNLAITSALVQTENRAETINRTIDLLSNILETKPSLNFTLQANVEHLDSVNNKLRKMATDLDEVGEILDSNPLHTFDNEAIIQNDSISIAGLEILLEAFKKPFKETDTVMSTVENARSDIDLLLTNMKHDASLLQGTLTEFEQREIKLHELNTDIENVVSKQASVETKLNLLNDSISALKTALDETKDEFSAYDPDDKFLRDSLQKNDYKVKELEKVYKTAVDKLQNIQHDFDFMNSTLSDFTNSRDVLRDKIDLFDNKFSPTTTHLNNVNETLDSILREIPLLENSLTSVKEDIFNLNDSLTKEDRKTNYIKKTLPVLKTKYEETNYTFSMVNKTFDEMENKLRKLDGFVEKVKSQMSKFDNINISLSNITSNLTYMEDRLVIMKQHYNNIKDIVYNLQRNLDGSSQFGKNTTLENITNTFSMYNLSIDKVDEVLGKIDMEFTEMDDHFAYMNDTLIMIDNDLEQYEDQVLLTNMMNEEISGLSKDLKTKDNKLHAMKETVDGLNSTFVNLQKIYKDVLNTTANKNSVFINTLLNASELIDNMQHVILDKLHNDEDFIRTSFGDMRNNFQQNISSSNVLDSILSDVHTSYDKIVDSLDTIIQNISDAKTHAGELNNLLSGIVNLLNEINSTLHAEQIKHNFINSNLLTFDDKLSLLGKSFDSTKESLVDLEGRVTNVSSLVSNVQKRMLRYPTLFFEMDEKAIKSIDKNLTDMQVEYKSMQAEFIKVKSDVSFFDDSSFNMTELDSQSDKINKTIDTLATDLFDMSSNILKRRKDTNPIVDLADQINSTLNAFTKVEVEKDKIGKELQYLNRNMTAVNGSLVRISNTMMSAGGKLTTMKHDFKNVNTSKSGILMDELLALTKEFNNKESEFINLKSTFENSSDALLLADDKFKTLEELLNTNIYSLDQFKNITQNSENSILDLHTEVSASNKSAVSIQTRTNNIEADILDLKERINSLNMSLFEEKQKEEFIAEKFKHMSNSYYALQERIQHSNSTIAKSFDKVAAISDEMSKLSLKLDRFSAINISLDSEKKYIEQERNKLEELLKLYKNVSEAHKTLNIENLQRTNKSFNEIQDDYMNFQNAMQRLEDSMKNIDDTISDSNIRLRSLNTTLADINDTVDNYERMENIINDHADKSAETNAGLNRTKQAAHELEEQITYLNKSLVNLGNTFNQISDPSLRNAKDNLEHVLRNFNEQLKHLQKTNNEMDTLKSGIQRRFGSINDTLSSTKNMITQLKEHIHNVNYSSSILAQDLNDMKTKQESAQNTATDLKPGLERVLQDLLNLTTSFEQEQQKLNFVANNKPLLVADYESLESKFRNINKRLSLTDLQLADLRYLIKTTGVRLDRFDTLAITTDPEMSKWEDHSRMVNDLSSKFIRLSSKYNLLKNDIAQLDHKNASEEELRNMFKVIRDTLQDIKTALERKNNTLENITDENGIIETVLEGFGKTVTNYEELQSNGFATKQIMENTLSAISNGSSALNEVTDLKNMIENAIKQMEIKYKSISNKDWELKISGFKLDLSFEESKLKLTKANLGSVQDVMQTTTGSFNKTYKTLTEQILNRNIVTQVIRKLDRNVNSANMTFRDTDVQVRKMNKELDASNKTLIGVWNKLTALNDTLFLEWEKYEYVKDTLPKLQDKLISVNKTFTVNLPSSMDLKNQISYLTVIVEKIEQKMKAYGVQDTDNAVKQWRKLIVKLNDTIRDIITRNEKSDEKLAELRSVLWSDKPMYTESETLAQVQTRFEDFDKTLEGIRTMSHSINLKLSKMDANSREMALAMENKDMMLTTTTTPANPPDWLSLTSSQSGVIAIDKGWLKCSATDLTKWDMMTISRKSPNGKEEVMAAWKQGVGARKPRTFRDRRVRVKRVLDNRGGGALRINITSVQCVDEATYFCSVDSHSMWPLKTEISVMSPPEDSLEPDFPTEVFEDKVANFSCTGRPGYPNGKLIWKIRRQNEAFFKEFDFYSAKSKVEDQKCTRTETNTVGYQFDMKWNNTRVRCYIENTDFYGEGVIRILPYTICNNVRDLGKIRHPYTPHKYIVCDRGLNIMQCPGNTCYDKSEGNCVQCKASVTGDDPCRGQPLFSYAAHERDCKKYYICMGPTKSTKSCSRGYFAKNIPGHCVLQYNKSECYKRKGGG